MPRRLYFTAQTIVPLDRPSVFDAFIDVTHYREWQRAVKRVVDVTGSPRVAGSTYVLDHGIGGRATVTVLDVDPPNLYRIKQRALRTEMTMSVRFTDVTAQETAVEATVEMDVGRLEALFIPGWLARRAIADELRQFGNWIATTASARE